MIQPGKTAYNFSLKDQDDVTFDLLENEGKRTLLSFHPLAWTGPCAAQMTDLEKNRERLAAENTVAVGISVDSVPCKKAWADHLGLTRTWILADFWPHGKVAIQYGYSGMPTGSPSGRMSSSMRSSRCEGSRSTRSTVSRISGRTSPS